MDFNIAVSEIKIEEKSIILLSLALLIAGLGIVLAYKKL